jgi:BirA family biotin operon repressor/biotin-[acetyl-CoA-carboxylase] ligase
LQNNTFLTLFVGQHLVKLQEIDSTNTYLKNLLSNSKPLLDGTVIMAERQFAGRGQNDNVWIGEANKNLTFSIYLKTSFLPVNNQFNLNKAVSLGIIDTLRPLIGDACKIKWPNDIYYHDKKIGGILIENVTKGYLLKESVIGIGLNVNQINFGNLDNRASSISKILQQDYDLHKLLTQICQNIESRYLQLKADKTVILAHDYLFQLYRLNEVHFFEINQKQIKGTIKGVSPNGKLILETDDNLKELDLKEVKFIID